MCENCRDEISSQGPREKESNSREGGQHYLEKTESREDRVSSCPSTNRHCNRHWRVLRQAIESIDRGCLHQFLSPSRENVLTHGIDYHVEERRGDCEKLRHVQNGIVCDRWQNILRNHVEFSAEQIVRHGNNVRRQDELASQKSDDEIPPS